uniref:Photosynthetic NDH subcomplex B 4 n=1 Tax=Hypseocharis bilobata TaxID=253189 RepID=A0A0F7GXZ5_9ROSI
MAETIMGFNSTIINPQFTCFSSQLTSKLDISPSSRSIRQLSSSAFNNGWHHQMEGRNKSKRGSSVKVNAFPDWPLMAVMLEQHVEYSKDLITNKSVVHLSDETIKNVYVFYIMFTCWGCMFFGSLKDPYYDSEQYRKDGGDGTGFWVYEKQEDIEESSRAALWREELIEEIEQKVGGLRELEEAGKK